MKRENYKVIVKGSGMASIYQSALVAIGEQAFSPFYENKCVDLIWNVEFKHWFCSLHKDDGKTVLGFKELIKLLVNVKEPLFIAEDDTEMFENSECHWVYEDKGKWHYNTRIDFCKNHVDMVTNQPHIYRIFGTEENAHHWLDKMNKPKEIDVKLYGTEMLAVVDNLGITFKLNDRKISAGHLSHSDIDDISHAITQLNQS